MGKKYMNVIAEIPGFSIVELDDGIGATAEPGWYTDRQLKRFLKHWNFPSDLVRVRRLQDGETVFPPVQE